MNGRLVIEGELSKLSAAAAMLAAEWAGELRTAVEPVAWMGYTSEVCRAIYNEANGNAKTVLRLVVENDGFVPDSVIRQELQHDSLRGMITGSITRAILRLEKAGTIPAGLPKPLETGTSTNTGPWGKIQGISMAPELVPLFKAALDI